MKTPLQLLIVEDNPDDADVLVGELRRSGFDPQWKRVELEEDFLAELKKAPDLVISDYSMPLFDGLRAAELLQESGLNIPFILVSGTVGEDVAVEAMKHGATDYLLKDRIARLGAAVEQALEQKRLREERKRAREEIQATHTQLRQLLDLTPAVIYRLKIDGEKIVPLMVSENITALLGFTIAERLHCEWWAENLHPEDYEQAVTATSEALSLSTSTTEYRLRHKDGSYRWVNDRRRLIRDADGRPAEFVGVWTEITERKRAEEVLRNVSSREAGRRKRRILIELGVIAALCVIVFIIGDITDCFLPAFRYIAETNRGAVDTHADESAGTLIFFCLAMLVFSYRRWREGRAEVISQANVVGALRNLHEEMETRIQQRTAELVKSNGLLGTEVAERKRAEEETRFQKLLLEAQSEASIDGILTVDANANIISFNRRFLEMWGIPAELMAKRSDEPVLQSVLDRVVDSQKFLERVLYLYEHPDLVSREEILLKDGRVFDRYTSPVKGTDGAYYGRIWTFRDITDRKQAEEELRLREDDLAEAQRVAKLGSWRYDITSNKVRWSDEIFRIFEIEKTCFEGTHEAFLNCVLPDDRSKVLQANAEAMEGGTSFEIEYRIQTRAGGLKTIQEIGRAKKDAGGKVVELFGTAQDITEQKKAQAKLHEREEQLRLYAEHSPAAVAMFDRNLNYLVVSRRWIEDYHLEGESIIGRSHYDVFNNIPQHWIEVHRRCLEGATRNCAEESFVRNDGVLVWIRWEALPWRQADGSTGGIMIFSEDITLRKQADEEIRTQLDELRRWNEATLGREDRVLELKGEVNTLLARLSQPPRYSSPKP